MSLTRRVEKLEGVQPSAMGLGHRVVVYSGQTKAEAVEAYGVDRIGPEDFILYREIIDAPRQPMISEAVH